MVRSRTFSVTVAVALATAAPAGSDVTVSGDRVSVQVQAMPASAVLDRIARATGMKVTYEGGQPRALVTVERTNVTGQEAVLSVMEGLGLSYALMLDRSGQKVDTLLVLGGPARPGASGGATARAFGRDREGFGRREVPPPPPPDEPEFVAEPTEEVDEFNLGGAPEQAADDVPFDATKENAGGPGQGPIVQPTPLPWPPQVTPPQPTPLSGKKQDEGTRDQ
jgi:hypothetical protein